MEQRMTGTFYGVSVGPGDPELLTLQAVRLLRQCPVDFSLLVGNGGAFLSAVTLGAAGAVLALPDSSAYPYDRLVDALRLPVSAWRRIGHLTGAGVLPDWRGNNLHLQLCQWRLGLTRADGRRHAAAYAAPRNPFSWHNLLAVGLRIKGIRLMGGDKLRYLLHIDYHDAPPPDPGTAVIIPADAIAEQRALLDQGYWGYAEAAPDADHGRQLWYARPLRL